MVVSNKILIKNPTRFLINRALRIFPTYYLTLVFFSILPVVKIHFLNYQIIRFDSFSVYGFRQFLIEIANYWCSLWAYLLLIFRNTNVAFEKDWNPALWTIDVELRAYLLMFAVVIFLRRSRDNYCEFLNLTMLIRVIFLAAIIDFASVFVSPMLMGSIFTSHSAGMFKFFELAFSPVTNAAGILYHLPFFLFGSALALRNHTAQEIYRKKIKNFLLFFFIISNIMYWHYVGTHQSLTDEPRIISTVLFCFSSIFIYYLANSKLEFPISGRNLDNLAGDLSYPIYLLNVPLAYSFRGLYNFEPFMNLLFAVFAIFSLSFIFVFIEKPLRTIRKKAMIAANCLPPTK